MTRYLLLTSALVLAGPAVAQERIAGVAKAADGDTLTLGADRIRLFGIDAPELQQTCQRGGQSWACGAEAKARLAALVDGREVVCSTDGVDDFGRLLARCTAAGVDLNQMMVMSGHAVAFRRYSTDYVPAEDIAKLARRGVWAGSFQVPSEYRQAERGGSFGGAAGAERSRTTPSKRQAASVSSRAVDNGTACVIKGNRSRRGDWIYHLPGMPYYEQTRAEEMFCSEVEARAAGYRRAIVR